MIDVSINNLLAVFTSLSLAGASVMESSIPGTEPSVEDAVKTVVAQFVKAGDQRDTARLEVILHPHFRVVANQLMGTTSVNIIGRDQYLSLIREGKLGGDQRVITMLSVEVVGKNAAVHARLQGSALTIDTFYHLVQLPAGHWQVVQDLPFVVKN